MPIIRVEKREIKLRRPLVDIPEPEFRRGLAASPTFPWLPTRVSSEEVLPVIQTQSPIDGREIVEWMQLAAAEGAILDQACEDYNRLGSLLISSANDPYLPGMRLGDLSVKSITGSNVVSAGGATVMTPSGNFNVPMGGKALGVFPDILAWARLAWAGSVQWILSLLQWRDLASIPIDQRVRFANLSGAVAPQFFNVSSMFPPPVMVMHLGFTSNRSQKVGICGRSQGDYTSQLFSDTLDVPAGESTLDYVLIGGLPINSFVLHMQPEDGSETILDSLSVTPP